jgi:hypothetical protein
MLEGNEISVPETYSIGCTIKWKNWYLFEKDETNLIFVKQQEKVVGINFIINT